MDDAVKDFFVVQLSHIDFERGDRVRVCEERL